MSSLELPLGPAMIDLAGTALTAEERARLRHPLVGGVILFTRNYASREQLAELTREIHALRSPRLLVAADHEGGRVQRFREGFTRLPPMRALGRLSDQLPAAGCEAARSVGYVLAAELRCAGVDLSFTPVLDLDYGNSGVIGERAFHRDPQVVAELAGALVEGLARAGVAAVGKHFPGHGFASADSHVAIPVDPRPLADIEAADIAPYRMLARALRGVMPAHVIYEAVDKDPAGFSRFWLQEVLRKRVGFDGVIFSDDLCMAGARVAGDIVARADAALRAGCDMVLVCNAPDQAADLLARWRPQADARSPARIAALLPGGPGYTPASLALDAGYRQALAEFERIPAVASAGDGCSPAVAS